MLTQLNHPQACFAISSCENWSHKDGTFSHVRFYKQILKIFEMMDAKWHDETLGWWKE